MPIQAQSVIECLAILIAGVWALTLFWEKEAPSLVPRMDVQGNLVWYDHVKDECQAEFEIELHNIGLKRLEVSKVQLSAWLLSESKDSKPATSIELLDPLEMRSQPPLLKQDVNRLVGSYAPDERNKHGFSFIVKGHPKPECMRLAQ